jgi:signal transduction histidine kinase
LAVIERGSPGDSPALAPLWEGRELYRTESRPGVYRAYIPFHANEALHLARIDLDAQAAEFLLAPARVNLLISSFTCVILVLLALYSHWAMRRSAQMKEHEHLAHIGTMAASLAHEIRNPLGTIKGFVQLAAEHSEPAVQTLLQKAVSETQRLERLVSDLLAYGRPAQPRLSATSWHEVASTLEVAVQGEDAALETDPDLLRQALVNVVRNAREASDNVVVTGTTEASFFRITVTDSGPGISDDAIRARPFHTTKVNGTGLGLAITRKLLEALGGRFELRRRAEGGTEAILRIPHGKHTHR